MAGQRLDELEATAPALNEFHKDYEKKGLVVIGLYHHKARMPLDAAKVEQSAKKLGFQFPIAIDRDWKTLKSWWLAKGDRRWTSVTFLIDRKGVIRLIHPGGQYVKGDKDYVALKNKIEDLIKEE
jgi:peroxiredoxin